MFKSLVLLLSLLWLPSKYNTNNGTVVNARPVLKTGWYYVTDKKSSYQRQQLNNKESYFIDPTSIALVGDFKIVKLIEPAKQGAFELLIQLDEHGTSAFKKATGISKDKRLGFILDNKLIYTAVVNAQISSGLAVISGYSKSELEGFANQIKSEITSAGK
jgi:preprotein translocase subunit SecD